MVLVLVLVLYINISFVFVAEMRLFWEGSGVTCFAPYIQSFLFFYFNTPIHYLHNFMSMGHITFLLILIATSLGLFGPSEEIG